MTLVAATAAENSALVELSAVTWCQVDAKGIDSGKESEVCLVGPPSEGLRIFAIIGWIVMSGSEDDERSERRGVTRQRNSRLNEPWQGSVTKSRRRMIAVSLKLCNRPF